jgi:hypothetical protein
MTLWSNKIVKKALYGEIVARGRQGRGNHRIWKNGAFIDGPNLYATASR